MKKPLIPHSRPTIGKEEIDAVSQVIASGQIAQGQAVAAFEEAFARKMGVRYAAAVSSGTAALHLALLALGVTPGMEVIIPSFVCTALLNVVNYTGATPVLADINPVTLNIDPSDVAGKVTASTGAIIVPHMFGLMADLAELRKFGVPLIEDCAQAVGADWDGKKAGSFGKIGIYSFYATKVMTCGEGGMVVSNENKLIDWIKQAREYDNVDAYALRYNYKMTDIQAAMGRQQLGRLNNLVARRREIAGQYRDAFDKLPFSMPPDSSSHIYYRFNLNVGKNVGRWIAQMEAAGVACARPVFKPLHLYLEGCRCTQADNAYEQMLSIPIYPHLSDGDVNKIVRAVTRISTKLNT